MPIDVSRDPTEYLASGDAWIDFCEEAKRLVHEILRETAPRTPTDLAEGHRFLTRMMRSAFELVMESGDANRPWFFPSLHESMKIGWDNPDNIHQNAYLNGNNSYRIRGTRGDAHYFTLGFYAGSFGSGGRRTVNYVAVDDLEIGSDGRWEAIASNEKPAGIPESNWIHIDPDTTTLMTRETFWDKRNERAAELHIECISDDPVPPLEPAFVVGALRRSLRYMQGSNKLFFDMSDMWKAKPNVFWPSDPKVAAETQGIPGAYYASGWWECGEDEIVVCDVVPPECRYWGFVLSNYWGESLEYRYHPVNTNKKRATYRPDGSLRLAIAHRDPEIPGATWISTEGHFDGIWTLRWLEADTHPLPDVRVVPFDQKDTLA